MVRARPAFHQRSGGRQPRVCDWRARHDGRDAQRLYPLPGEHVFCLARDNLKQLKSIAFDAGDKDTAIAATTRTLDTMLTSYGLPHVFEIYDGNHVNHIADRVEQHVLPFFSNTLAVTSDSP